MADDPFLAQRGVSRETEQTLRAFAQNVGKWSQAINLVSPSTLSDVWTRHIIDSAQLFFLSPGNTNIWCDLGSGGGLPGVVVAILSKQFFPKAQTVLIESDRRKAAFLKLAAGTYGVNIRVLAQRAEVATPQCASVVSARALAPLTPLLGLVYRHMSEGGSALLPKGQNHEEEVDTARRSWHFTTEAFESRTDASARILRITKLMPKVEEK